MAFTTESANRAISHGNSVSTRHLYFFSARESNEILETHPRQTRYTSRIHPPKRPVSVGVCTVSYLSPLIFHFSLRLRLHQRGIICFHLSTGQDRAFRTKTVGIPLLCLLFCCAFSWECCCCYRTNNAFRWRRLCNWTSHLSIALRSGIKMAQMSEASLPLSISIYLFGKTPKSALILDMTFPCFTFDI